MPLQIFFILKHSEVIDTNFFIEVKSFKGKIEIWILSDGCVENECGKRIKSILVRFMA